MARRKKSGRRKGVGSIVRVRRVSGLGQLNQPGSMMGSTLPVIVGGGVAALTTIGIAQWMDPLKAENKKFIDNAPWLGLGAGIVAGLGLGAMTRKKPTTNMAVAAAVVTSLAFLLPGWMAGMAANGNGNGATTAGLRAIVPEYGMRGLGGGRRGTGAIVMEPQASRGYGAGPLGSYGETVNLGRVNTGAFGTPGFGLNGGRG